MNHVLIVTDMQNDYITGVLGTKEARDIADRVAAAIEEWDGPVYATRDTHAERCPESPDGKKPSVPCCIRGTEGWEIEGRVAEALRKKGAEVLDKPTFGSMELARVLLGDNAGFHDGSGPIAEVMLIGLHTGTSIISNALLIRTAMPNVPIRVDASCCACFTPESHRTALEAMKLCRVDIRDTMI